VYIGRKEKIEGAVAAEGGEDEEGGSVVAATEQLKYVAATESHKFLLGKALLNNKGVTFDVFRGTHSLYAH
jgi:hypothetical protein